MEACSNLKNKNLEVKLYNSDFRNQWDSFVDNAKNKHFMFFRNFMEYHNDRFEDHSLMFFLDSKLLAILPAHRSDNVLASHKGLTFAGFIVSKSMKLYKMFDLFEALINYLKDNSFEKLIYKSIPHIYHSLPAMEDLYVLSHYGAELLRRDASSVVDLRDKLGFEKGRRGCVKKAKKEGLVIKEDEDLRDFVSMMENHLKEKYDSKPVHTSDELVLLKNHFPENIKLFSAHSDTDMLAGILVFISGNVIKTQYISSNETGRNLGAIDLLADYLINDKYNHLHYFDFGTSTDDSEFGFNDSLMAQKEMFGARTVIADTYSLTIK